MLNLAQLGANSFINFSFMGSGIQTAVAQLNPRGSSELIKLTTMAKVIPKTCILPLFLITGGKCKGLPQQAQVAQGVPGRIRSRISLTFGTTRVVGRQPYAPATFTPGEIPGTHFQRLSRPQGTWFCRQLRKKSPVTPPGIDPETVGLVAQCLNHYAIPGQSLR